MSLLQIAMLGVIAVTLLAWAWPKLKPLLAAVKLPVKSAPTHLELRAERFDLVRKLLENCEACDADDLRDAIVDHVVPRLASCGEKHAK